MYDHPSECQADGCWRAPERGGTLCPKHALAAAAKAREEARQAAKDQPPPPGLWDSADTLPVLPYAGTSGHAGTPASQARARQADTTGGTVARQARTLEAATAAGDHGITWRDLAAATGWHHGTASGTLSVLSRTGYLVCLEYQRQGCHVYVLPHHQGTRPLAPRRATAGTRLALEVLEAVDSLLAAGQVAAARQAIASARSMLGGA